MGGKTDMNTDEIIKRVMANTPMPESLSTYQAFKQFENELSQHYTSEISRLQTALKVAEDALKRLSEHCGDMFCECCGATTGICNETLAEIAKIKTPVT
jgi:hypothetical protein